MPGRRRSCGGPAGPPHHRPPHAPDLATSRSRCTSCIPRLEAGVPLPPAHPSAARHAGAPPCRGRGRHASQAARPVEAPDLALLRGPGDPCGNHQPGSSLQGSLLRLSYSAWFRNLLPTSCFKRLVSGHYRQAARLTADTGPDAALAFYLSKADPLLVLRDLLGHSSVLTTEKYLRRLDTTRIYREAYERAGVADGLLGDADAEREADEEFTGAGPEGGN